ncbi:MAG TPA: thioredoxin domain-containing protein [Terracidiphilus sp.]|jgi:protein-disulfide isomerase|nr:thioredoxin domain-containing protein [Terracidiphilus sp.]
MLRSFASRTSFCFNLAGLAVAAALLAAPDSMHAQFAPPPAGTQVHDPSALKPPPGARVAIVEFDDMECPDCARANPLLHDAAANYKIPWVRHDFPLSFHVWSTQAAINARWFDTRDKKLGDDYRDAVFANQPSIADLSGLRQFTEKFAADHKIALPFAIDPQGKLQALVKADFALGQRIGIEHTPTIWVVTAGGKGAPFVEVIDRSRLYQIIDQAIAETRSEPKTDAPAHSGRK